MPAPRPRIAALRRSEIREVANAGLGRKDVIPLWFGEADRPAAEPIRRAAAEALLEGRAFYTHNLGRPDLRAALGDYLTRLHARPLASGRLAVTSSGVSALMIAAQAVLEPGDRVVVVGPVWPNLVEIPKILGAKVTVVPIRPVDGRFRLDLDALLDAIGRDARLVMINSPNNPTGWTLPEADRAPILERCRRIGAWLLADDVYERLAFTPSGRAPSFLDLAEPDDRLISANSFSKTWRMTGFRLGWLVAPESLNDALGALIEYNTSCAPDFVQIAALAALAGGEAEVEDFRRELLSARGQVVEGLRRLPGVEAPLPDGGLYSFFRLEGRGGSKAVAKALVSEAGLGLAPGSAFGPEGEGWLRWCFAVRPETNAEGLRRLSAYLA